LLRLIISILFCKNLVGQPLYSLVKYGYISVWEFICRQSVIGLSQIRLKELYIGFAISFKDKKRAIISRLAIKTPSVRIISYSGRIFVELNSIYRSTRFLELLKREENC